jgi:hypothetical protein
MSTGRRLFILTLVALADSLWLYPVVGVYGLATDQSGSPIAWLGILSLLFAGLAATRLLVAVHGSSPTTYMTLAGLGLVAVFLTVAAHVTWRTGSEWDFAWFARLARGDVTGPEVISILVTMLCTAYLWRRAIRIADEPTPDDRLRTTFRTGTLALALVLVIEFATSIDLQASDALIPFFLVSLCGLAFIHRPQNSAMARSWTKIALATVALIVTGGFLFGVLGGEVGSAILSVAKFVWDHFLAAAAWLLELLLAPLLELFFSLIESLRPDGDGAARPTLRPDMDWEQINVAKAAPFVDAVISFLRFPLIALFLYLLISYLIKTHRHWNVIHRVSPVDIAHEPIEREGDALGDLARIIETFMPDWMKRRAASGWRFPKGLPGFSEVYELYFDMLDTASKQGVVTVLSATPLERIDDIEVALPEAPASALTQRFNAACFGKLPTDEAALKAIRQSMQTARRK